MGDRGECFLPIHECNEGVDFLVTNPKHKCSHHHDGIPMSSAWLKSALTKGDFVSYVTLKSDHDEVACKLDRAYVGHA